MTLVIRRGRESLRTKGGAISAWVVSEADGILAEALKRIMVNP